MKNLCIIHVLLFILLMLVYQCTKAQDYIVLAAGDSLSGEIKPLTFGPEKKVQFTAADKKKTLYTIFQIRAFSFKGDIFHPVKGGSGYVFMKLVKPGYLSLYAYQMENMVTYDGLFLQKRDGSAIDVPNLAFKKHMSRYLADCPDVVTSLNEGSLSRKDIDKVVDAYNDCIQKRTIGQNAGITQTKEQPKKITSWDTLEEKVKAKSDFEGKSDALEMITDIKNKIQRNEKIPNFLLEGLKSALVNADLTAELDTAINEVKN